MKKFPSWKNEYNKLQNEKKKNNSEWLNFQKHIQVSFNDLKIQNNYSSTDDGCIHYKNVINNQIYSWNYIKNEWEEHSVNYQNGLSDLFTIWNNFLCRMVYIKIGIWNVKRCKIVPAVIK